MTFSWTRVTKSGTQHDFLEYSSPVKFALTFLSPRMISFPRPLTERGARASCRAPSHVPTLILMHDHNSLTRCMPPVYHKTTCWCVQWTMSPSWHWYMYDHNSLTRCMPREYHKATCWCMTTPWQGACHLWIIKQLHCNTQLLYYIYTAYCQQASLAQYCTPLHTAPPSPQVPMFPLVPVFHLVLVFYLVPVFHLLPMFHLVPVFYLGPMYPCFILYPCTHVSSFNHDRTVTSWNATLLLAAASPITLPPNPPP